MLSISLLKSLMFFFYFLITSKMNTKQIVIAKNSSSLLTAAKQLLIGISIGLLLVVVVKLLTAIWTLLTAIPVIGFIAKVLLVSITLCVIDPLKTIWR